MTALVRIPRPARAPHMPDTPLPRRRHRPADGVGRLVQVLVAHAARAGCRVAIEIVSVTPWSSATFVGSVATLALTAAPCPALARWLAALPEAEIPLGRDLVADLAVEDRRAAGDGVRLCVLICNGAAGT
jgi:hypothetical protein